MYGTLQAFCYISLRGQRKTHNKLPYSDPTRRHKLVLSWANFPTSLRRLVGQVSKALGSLISMKIQFDPKIKAGDILTSVSILISAIALLVSLAKDRATRVADQANKVRLAAATTLVKLDRWQNVQESFYDELQPDFVALSQDLKKNYDVVAVRDRFWIKGVQARARVLKQVSDEQLLTGYVDLLTHFPAAREKVSSAFASAETLADMTTKNFMAKSEQAIFKFNGKESTYQTAFLGNAFRQEALISSAKLHSAVDKEFEPVRKYLFTVIALPDGELVNVSRR